VQVRESGTFRDPLPIYLTQMYALTSSVIVTSPDRSRFYVLGRDYVVSQVRNRTAVHRLPTGLIADGDSVLINYSYRRVTRSRIDNQRVDVRVEQQFDMGLRPYYEFNLREQQIRQPIDFPFDEDNVARHRVGADYVRDRWSIGLEYEREDNSYDPFDAIHANGQWTVYRDVRLDTAVTANYSRFYFDSPDNRDVDLLDLGWDTSWTINPRTSTSLLTAYRWENDSVDGVTHGVDLTATLAHRIGQTEIEMTAEYDLLEFDESSDDGFSFWLRVRRNFGGLLR
jgi:hypothetical protein